MTDFIDSDGVIDAKPFVRSRYNYDMNEVSDATGLYCRDETRAQQQFKDETDINTIVERFGLTGQLPNDLRMPLQEDFVDVMDYQEALNQLLEADKAFMQLPANVRAEFQNDAGRFVAFASDEANAERCVELGLAVRKPKAAGPLEVRVVPEEPAQNGA